MRSFIIFTIFGKEIKEVLRDKRMLYLVILMPFFLYPLILSLMGNIGAKQKDKLDTQTVGVWLDSEFEDSPVFKALNKNTHLDVELKDFEKKDLENTKGIIGIHLSKDEASNSKVQFYIDHSQDVLVFRYTAIASQLQMLNQLLLQGRLIDKDLPPSFLHPISIEDIDVSPQESGDRFILAMLPMMILLFVFMGCIYIAIDVTAGEKERKTLQTLFTTGATTIEIVIGKFLAVISVGITSAIMNLLSLVVAMKLQAYFLGETSKVLNFNLDFTTMSWLVIIIVLVAVFIGALSLAIILLANSYKEAQSYVTPLMMVVLLPSFLAMMPGVELSMQTAFIPMLNTALAILGLFKGNYDFFLFGIVAFMSIVYSGLALYLASLTFGNENVVTGQRMNLKQVFENK